MILIQIKSDIESGTRRTTLSKTSGGASASTNCSWPSQKTMFACQGFAPRTSYTRATFFLTSAFTVQSTSRTTSALNTLGALEIANPEMHLNARPLQEWLEYAKLVLKTSLEEERVADDGGEAFESDSDSESDKTLRDEFLAVFNGDWQNWSQSGLRHYCCLGCPCGGKQGKELGEYAKVLYCKLVLSRKPQIPALNRWLKCRTTSRWFFLAFSVHGIYLHGSQSLYDVKGTRKQSLQATCAALQSDLASMVQDAGGSGEPSMASAFTLIPDLPLCKIMRVRARKSAEWVTAEYAGPNLAITLLATKPAYDLSHWLFAQQRATRLSMFASKRKACLT